MLLKCVDRSGYVQKKPWWDSTGDAFSFEQIRKTEVGEEKTGKEKTRDEETKNDYLCVWRTIKRVSVSSSLSMAPDTESALKTNAQSSPANVCVWLFLKGRGYWNRLSSSG